jgi:hypothetical protein
MLVVKKKGRFFLFTHKKERRDERERKRYEKKRNEIVA